MPLRQEFVSQIINEYTKFSSEDYGIKGNENTVMGWELLPSDKIRSVPLVVTAFANRGTHMNAVMWPMWTGEKDDAKARQWARDIDALFEEELKETRTRGQDLGKNGVMLYGNYDDGRKYSPIVRQIVVPSTLATA